jgi:hypothetical protein
MEWRRDVKIQEGDTARTDLLEAIALTPMLVRASWRYLDLQGAEGVRYFPASW